MAHLLSNLARTAGTVITYPLAIAKKVAGTALDRVRGRRDSDRAGERPRSAPPEPETPPVRRTADEAVARERAGTEPPPAPAASGEDEDELLTPSGIPAADPGMNPDTAETDLYQPETEPIVDPATVKAVKSEAETMRKAASRKKD